MRPVLYCVICFSCGIALSCFFTAPLCILAAAGIASAVFSLLFFRKNLISHLFLYTALALFGTAYYQHYNILPADHISNLSSEMPRPATLRGVVADGPSEAKALFGKKNISFTLNSGLVTEDKSVYKATGPVRINIYTGEHDPSDIKFGDEIIVRGLLRAPRGTKNPGLFDYVKYLKIRNIYAVMSVNGIDSAMLLRRGNADPIRLASYRLRDRIEGAIKSNIGARYSGFLNAILVGERSALDSSITDDFIKTGTVHVIAISGLNIALIACILMFVLKPFGMGRKLNLALASLGLVFYCFASGANPPVVRATIMFIIAAAGYIIDRESDILNMLAVAAFLILLRNPNELFEASFQLSFASIYGMVLLTPKIEALFRNRRGYLVKATSVSLAAMVSVGPIVAKYFNIISPVAVIANLVIVPALFIITIASFILLLFDICGLALLSSFAAGFLSFLVEAVFHINHFLASLPLSYIRVPAPSLLSTLFYYTCVFIIFFSKRRKEFAAALILLAGIFVWKACLAAPPEKLKITFLDVGQGDSILVETPQGGNILIDAGPGGEEGLPDAARSVVAPYLWNKGINRLDAVITTHFHTDHAGGIPYILKNFEVGCALDSGMPKNRTRLYDLYRRTVSARQIRRLAVYSGDEITGFGATKFFVINPAESSFGAGGNEDSTVIKLEYEDFSVLFCADVSGKGIEEIFKYKDMLRSEILKVPHHGGSVGSEALMKIFFQRVSPKVVIVSSGPAFRSKSSQRPDIYSGTAVYDTKDRGAVEVFTDGRSFTVKPFLQKN